MKSLKTFLAFFLLLVLTSALNSAEMTSRQAQDLVELYCNEEVQEFTEEQRFNLYLNQTATYSSLRRQLRSRDSEIIHRAIELTGKLRHERATNLLRSYISREHEEYCLGAIQAVLRTNTNDGKDWLFREWRSADIESDLYYYLTDELSQANLSLDNLEYLMRKLRDPDDEKYNDAKNILANNLETFSEVDALQEKFEELKPFLQKRDRPVRATGTNLLQFLGKGDSGFFLENKIQWNPPEYINYRTHIITLNVWADSEAEFSVGYGTEQGYWSADVEDGKAKIEFGDYTNIEKDIEYEQWITFEWEIKIDPNRNLERVCAFSIEGEPLVNYGSFNGEIEQNYVRNLSNKKLILSGWSVEIEN